MNSKTVTEQFKKVAVWDTYVKRASGAVRHFDIIVPDGQHNASLVHEYGRDYLVKIGEVDATLSTAECRFCHIEKPTDEMLLSIAEKGYYILEMEEIPETLPSSPSRRNMILHLRAHYSKWRFADFSGKSEDDVKQLLIKEIR